ncbi:ATP-binding cassette domain-containing protein [Hymenobacter arizonensis]|uniref:ABC-type multidrug transport system, ATPase component n=1 Tax=Hymenobacter arizonensis TaxID=1227077 RepID=A0A1I5SE79_HYMAR|nr:ATP-binding cassette domain-containing protein [Hymenobacter arizonensis]SFP69012.1 ABC-type multidrug transport system, ATPase component [Hymenobacter arizonensis]
MLQKLAGPKATHVLEADGIRLSFGSREVLTDIYLRVQTGQIVGLLGRNGCGKSSLLQTVFGARTVADASVRVDGKRTVPAFRIPGLLNYLPQVPMLPANLSLRKSARLLRVDLAQATANFPELRTHFDACPSELSGGTARLLQVLLMLHARTAFSLFDEPFTGIMPVHLETLAVEMQQAKQRKGLLLSDPRYEEVLSLCDVVYLLHQGRLLKLGPNPRAQLRDYGYLAS